MYIYIRARKNDINAWHIFKIQRVDGMESRVEASLKLEIFGI